MQIVERTTAHFMSGLNLGGGIAWLGVRARGVFARACVRVVCVVVVGGVGWEGGHPTASAAHACLATTQLATLKQMSLGIVSRSDAAADAV